MWKKNRTQNEKSGGIYPGAGKHPSPLEKTKTNSPNHYLTVVFYRIKKYCSYQKLLRFKDCSTRTPVTSCQPPIDRYFGRVHIWVLASTRALLKKKKKKKKKLTQTNSPHHYLTVGFYRIKKYCSYQKLWLFFCDFLPAPIYVG